MNKAISVENSNKNVVRVLSIAEPEIIENNPTDREYFLIENYTEPPVLDNPLSINYPIHDKVNKQFKWVQVQYQNTATEEIIQIENLKVANATLQNSLMTANANILLLDENINMLLELQADTLGGAI